MHADAYYSIGRSHTVCQDVARSGVARGTLGVDVPYVVVCDGCSGSPQTEFGAQILAQTTVHELRNFQAEHADEALVRGHFIKGMVRAAIFRAAMIAGECRLPAGALDATLLTATVAGGVAHLSMSGDGSAFWRQRGGRARQLVTVEFKAGAPTYPSYGLSEARTEPFSPYRDPAWCVPTTMCCGGRCQLMMVTTGRGCCYRPCLSAPWWAPPSVMPKAK